MFNFPAFVFIDLSSSPHAPDDHFFESDINDPYCQRISIRSKEKRIRALENLVLSQEEFSPFQTKIHNFCDRKIVLAGEILKEAKNYNQAKLLKTLKMIGLFVGVALVGIAIIASLSGAVYGLSCLINLLNVLITSELLMSLLVLASILLECVLGFLAGSQGFLLLVWMLEKGREVINNSSNMGSLEDNLRSKFQEWSNSSSLLRMKESLADINEKLPRLSDLTLRDALAFEYVKHQISINVNCPQFLSGELERDQFFRSLNRGEFGVHNPLKLNHDVFWCWPQTIQKYDQLQLNKAEARNHLLNEQKAPTVLVELMLSYMA